MDAKAQHAKGMAFKVVQAMRVQAKCGRDTAEGLIRWIQIFEFIDCGYLSDTALNAVPKWAEAILEEHDLFMDSDD